MRIPHGLRAALASQGAAPPSAYQIQRSLRCNSADSAYLSRTPASAGNRKTWTWSGWVKRAALGGDQALFSGGATGSDRSGINITSDSINFYDITSNSVSFQLLTTAKLRDPSAWYHIVATLDTTQATSSNRAKVWVNGVEVTAFTTANYPAQNAEPDINAAVSHAIGTNPANELLSGYLADIHFIDGQALTPTSFAETNATTGQWVPKAYSGSFGSQGWKLDFADNSNTTAGTLGKDTSGNGLNWTPSGFSVTAGAGNDSLVDTPTSYGTDTGAGGEVRGNYATLNPLIATSSTLSNGNLDYTSTATYQSAFGTIGVKTGKWYIEGTVGTFASDALIGVGSAPFNTATYVGGSATSWGYEGAIGRIYTNGTYNAYGATFGAGDVIGVAFDADTGKLWFAKNGTWQASGNPATGTNPAVTLTTGIDYLFGVSAGNGGTWTCNFGQRPFAYTAPSGFKALCDTNLPTPAIAQPNTVMNMKLYTGNGSTQTISGLGFSPDLVWIKSRAAAYAHVLHDTVRGASKQLFSNLTNAEQSDTNQLTAFNSDGFTLGDNSTGTGGVNFGTGGYVAWCWDAGSSTVTNTQGSITSSVRANTSAGFSIVTYTGTGSAATVGHGLGVAPSLVIVKRRDSTGDWCVWSKMLYDAYGASTFNFLNDATGATNNASVFNGNTSSTTFPVATNAAVNGSGGTYVAYCFAPVAGYSSFGSYTGNGSTDGPFVYTGMKSRFILIKGTNLSYQWYFFDTARSTYNIVDIFLRPNTSESEFSGYPFVDVTANGFKLRSTNNEFNANGSNYVYAAFAENPFQYARAR